MQTREDNGRVKFTGLEKYKVSGVSLKEIAQRTIIIRWEGNFIEFVVQILAGKGEKRATHVSKTKGNPPLPGTVAKEYCELTELRYYKKAC